jgi:hypothetical protein
MEPLNDRELNQLLEQWRAPAAPPSLAARVLPAKTSGWQWLYRGTIRVPVPVGLAILALLAAFLFFRPPARAVRPPAARPTVSLSDFQPVGQLQPRLIGRIHEGN